MSKNGAALFGVPGIACALLLSACTPEPIALGKADYSEDGARCEAGSRTGPGGVSDQETTPKGVRYNVRTPVNYDATRRHPLLLVLPAAGHNRLRSENFTQLTPAATAAGMIVVYSDHIPLSIPVIVEIGKIPGLVAEKWCVDTQRVYLTGHSDGGIVSNALAFLDETRGLAAAIAPSGAGLRGSDLKDKTCPEPLPVMVVHSKDDEEFPGYGAEVAKWWASCNRCGEAASEPRGGCRDYPACAEGVTTRYCEVSGEHGEWHGLNSALLEFFSAAGRAKG
ncbi:MAG: alpha/beta hydrolase family esterase [Gammaproteobacteria bacterium]